MGDVLTPDERAVAAKIAATVDLATPLVGNGIAWLRALHCRNVAAAFAYVQAIEADATSPEERVAKLGSGWSVRCIGSRETFPTIIRTKREAIQRARINGTVAYDNACDRLRDALALVDADTKGATP